MLVALQAPKTHTQTTPLPKRPERVFTNNPAPKPERSVRFVMPWREDLDENTKSEFLERAWPMLWRADALTIDLSGCDYLSEEGAGVIIGTLWRKARERGVELRVRATGQPRTSLQTKLAGYASELLTD